VAPNSTSSVSPGSAPLVLRVRSAVEWLGVPIAADDLSPLSEQPYFIVDLRGDSGVVDEALVAGARAALVQLPCVTIGLGPVAATRAAAELASALDVVLDERADLDRVIERVTTWPHAASMLAQTLRLGSHLPISHGLFAESLAYGTLLDGAEHRAWLGARPPRRHQPPHREPAVLASRTGDRLDLTLNRAAKRNAYSAEMRDALLAGLDIALGDDSLRLVVISGAGPSFCAGGDLDEFGTHPDLATSHAIRTARAAGRSIAACAERVRFEVHGACIGAGVELAAFASRVVAKPDSLFELPELSMGLIPGAGGTVSLPRRIGRQRTAFLALSGARIDAATALAWGLVDEIAENEGEGTDG